MKRKIAQLSTLILASTLAISACSFSLPEGTSVPLMLPFWLLGLLILYPLCLWYGRFKQGRSVRSLIHLF